MNALDTAASLCEDGSISLFVTNLSQDNAFTVELPVNYALKESIVLSADSFDSFNTLDREVVKCERISAPHTLKLVPSSVNLLVLEKVNENA